MKSWYDIYVERASDSYRNYVREQYKPFLDILKNCCDKTTTSVELGCGAATISRILMEDAEYKNIICIDEDWDMSSLAWRMVGYVDNVLVTRRDITSARLSSYIPSSGKVVFHSHGVLEHLSDEGIRNVTDQLKQHGVPQIHYVPSDKWITPSRGDERLMTPADWNDICHPDNIVEFNDGKDLILLFNINE